MKKNKKRKFTNGVLVRALEAKPGWIEIFFLQETAQTISLNQYLYKILQNDKKQQKTKIHERGPGKSS